MVGADLIPHNHAWEEAIVACDPILNLDGSPLRHLVLDPTKDYQPMP